MAQEVLFGFVHRVLPRQAVPDWRPYVRPALEHAPTQVVERPPIAVSSD
jgi:hypothetical protein